MDYAFHIITLIGVFATLSVSFELIAGQAGLLSLAHAALYGVGAYGTAILGTRTWVPLELAFIVGVACAVLSSMPIGLAATRLGGDRFVLATLAFQVFATSVFENWINLTGGPLGISGVAAEPGALSSVRFAGPEFAFVASALALITVAVRHRLSHGPFGRVLHCLRDDEAVALTLGKRARRAKFEALAVSGGLAGAAGGIYAMYATYVNPYSFTLNESIGVATMAIVGGLRTAWGPVVGAAGLVVFPEVLRFSGLPDAVAAPMNQVLFGAALVWVVLARPQGLLGPEGGSFVGGGARW